MRISAWSSDVCSSDLLLAVFFVPPAGPTGAATVETLTDDLRISSLGELRTTEQVIEEQAPDASASATVTAARQALHRHLHGKDKRTAGGIGTCPIRDIASGIDYARHLRQQPRQIGGTPELGVRRWK